MGGCCQEARRSLATSASSRPTPTLFRTLLAFLKLRSKSTCEYCTLSLRLRRKKGQVLSSGCHTRHLGKGSSSSTLALTSQRFDYRYCCYFNWLEQQHLNNAPVSSTVAPWRNTAAPRSFCSSSRSCRACSRAPSTMTAVTRFLTEGYGLLQCPARC